MNKLINYKMIAIIQILMTSILVFALLQLNIIPYIYILGIILILSLIHVVLFVMNKNNNIFTKIISVLVSFCLLIPLPYVYKSKSMLDEITKDKNEKSLISLIVLKDSEYISISDLNKKNIAMSNVNLEITKEAITKLEESIIFNKDYYENLIDLGKSLYDKNCDALLIDEAFLQILEQFYKNILEDTRVLWTYEYEYEQTKVDKLVPVDESCFNVYVSGIDTRGDVSTISRSDVNMVATVNTQTNQILLTSIPRDYYVYIPELKNSDKLTHAGLSGINSSVSTLEELLGINIDYYVRVNFSSLITIVDALGGIAVNVSTPINYNGIYSVDAGVNFMDGEKALWFSRHRETLKNGDNDRILNQQRVIQGILNKLISPSIIKNYMGILDSVSGSFETNMPYKEITDLLKEQLRTMHAWDFQSYSLSGTGSYFTGGAMMPDAELYYCVPDKNSVKKATDYINMMMDGEFIIVE